MTRLIKLLFLLPLVYTQPMVSYAQKSIVPGYQGKKILAGIGVQAMSTFYGVNKKNKSSDNYDTDGPGGLLTVNSHININAGYVFTRRLTGTLSLGTGKAGLLRDADFLSQSTGSQFRTKGFYNFRYSYAAFGIQIQKKRRWGIAPIGPFWGLQYVIASPGDINLLSVEKSGTYDYIPIAECDCELIDNQVEATPFPPLEAPESNIHHSFHFTFGSRMIIKNNFYYEASTIINPLKVFSERWNFSTQEQLNNIFALSLKFEVGLLF